jgi:hypothetical protein
MIIFQFSFFDALAAMAILPEVLRIPDGPENLSLPAPDLPISQLMELRLPPQRKSTTFADPSDYLSGQHPTVTTFMPSRFQYHLHLWLRPLAEQYSPTQRSNQLC